jgi:hypothetical protein
MSFIDTSPVFLASRNWIEGGSFAKEMSLGGAFGAFLTNYQAFACYFGACLPLPTPPVASRIHLRTGFLHPIRLIFNHLPVKVGDLPSGLSESLTDSGELAKEAAEKTVIRNMLIVNHLRENISRFGGCFWGWHSPCE